MRAWPCSLVAVLASGCFVSEPGLYSVVNAEEIGSVESSPAIQGRDGGGSALVFDRVVFAFGDTVLNVPDIEGEQWHHNSFSFTDDRDASDGIGPLSEPLDAAGAPRYFIAPTAEEAAFNQAHRGEHCESPCGARWAVWPGEPIWDEKRQRALAFYGLIYAEPGDFNFHSVGASLAVWSSFEAEPERPIVNPDAEHPTLVWSEDELAPGVGGQIVGDELWSFACTSDGFLHPCMLMSAPLDRVLEHDAWRYWDGGGWSPSAARAKELFQGAPIMSVEWNAYLESFMVLYSVPLTNDVALRTAPELTGPWSESTQLFSAKRAEGFTYDAVAHSAFAEDGGRVIYVTYSQPTGETWFSTRFPIVRVELLRRND